MLGDGYCDQVCNTYECAYDLGDCDEDSIGYGSFRNLKDEYEQAIWNSHKLIETVFGKATFQAAMHLPLVMNKRIWNLIEYVFPKHYDQAITNKFRKWTDFQYQYTYEAFIREFSIHNTTKLNLLFYLLDTNKNGILSIEEIESLDDLDRLNSIIFKKGIRSCYGYARSINLHEYLSCDILHNITRRIFVYIGKHVDVSSNIIWNPQMEDSIHDNIKILESIKKKDIAFLCINDGMKTSADQMRPILKEFYDELFPQKTVFEK